MNTLIHQRLQLLSDPLRLRLLHVLLKAELNVGELTTILQTPQSSISRHLKKLLAQHWISKRNEASTRWYAFRPELLPTEDQKLWDAIKEQDPDLFSEDHLRLQSYLSMRSIDSRHFFQNIGIRWREVRSGLFGDSFLLPTLLSLLPRIFDPFTRAEKSRAKISGGLGLGLLLVHQIIEAHSGEIKAFNHPEGGLVMEMWFPSPVFDEPS